MVFHGPRVVVFCDGDFWHGKDWRQRQDKLRRGANADYWVAKIARNIERDKANRLILESEGWRVLRYWESEIKRDIDAVADEVSHHVACRRP